MGAGQKMSLTVPATAKGWASRVTLAALSVTAAATTPLCCLQAALGYLFRSAFLSSWYLETAQDAKKRDASFCFIAFCFFLPVVVLLLDLV